MTRLARTFQWSCSRSSFIGKVPEGKWPNMKQKLKVLDCSSLWLQVGQHSVESEWRHCKDVWMTTVVRRNKHSLSHTHTDTDPAYTNIVHSSTASYTQDPQETVSCLSFAWEERGSLLLWRSHMDNWNKSICIFCLFFSVLLILHVPIIGRKKRSVFWSCPWLSVCPAFVQKESVTYWYFHIDNYFLIKAFVSMEKLKTTEQLQLKLFFVFIGHKSLILKLDSKSSFCPFFIRNIYLFDQKQILFNLLCNYHYHTFEIFPWIPLICYPFPAPFPN